MRYPQNRQNPSRVTALFADYYNNGIGIQIHLFSQLSKQENYNRMFPTNNSQNNTLSG